MSLELRIQWRVASLALFFAIAVQWLVPWGQVASAQSLRNDTSLSFAPAETSFFVSMLRNREQYDRLVQTKAFEKLRSLPFVRAAVAQIKEQMEEQGIADFFDEAENQQLLSVLCDALSDEVFVFSDDRFAVWISAMNQVGNTMNMARLKAMQTGDDPDVVMRREVLNLFLKNPDLIRSPTTVIGFHLSAVDQAQEQIVRLENLVRKQLDAEAPELRDRLTREKIGEAEFLTFRLDGTLVPWDQVLQSASAIRSQCSQKHSSLANFGSFAVSAFARQALKIGSSPEAWAGAKTPVSKAAVMRNPAALRVLSIIVSSFWRMISSQVRPRGACRSSR